MLLQRVNMHVFASGSQNPIAAKQSVQIPAADSNQRPLMLESHCKPQQAILQQ